MVDEHVSLPSKAATGEAINLKVCYVAGDVHTETVLFAFEDKGRQKSQESRVWKKDLSAWCVCRFVRYGGLTKMGAE